MKYRIQIIEQQKGFIDIEAKNFEEASKIATEEYHNGNIHWTSCEIIDIIDQTIRSPYDCLNKINKGR